MLNPASPLSRLFAAPVRPGVVRWIGLRPERRAPMVTVPHATLDPGAGLQGDRYRNSSTRTRQVTLVAEEDLRAIASYLGRDAVPPEQLRRNIVVSGLNLRALKGARLQLGSAVLAITGECHPCSRMEETLGTGGYNAVRGHGGLCARILAGGEVALGDAVLRLDGEAPGA
ncbi:MOSC domain-containing protein [Roseomonas elaeocarpi]|uniref:MOSC domain-containing protein n=1 Tax=Roseomonas elaeocarpi TaxID=907779 RepID=A0ABV6K010_9PROT